MNILLRLATIALLFSTPLCIAAEKVAGRWEGSIQIPGREFPLIVDLDQPGGKKDWAGSIIIQGLGVKGAPLTDLAVKDSAISFTIKGALGNERVGPAKFQGLLGDGASCAGAISAARTVISMPSNKSISLNPNGRLAASNQDNAIACRESDHTSIDLTSTY